MKVQNLITGSFLGVMLAISVGCSSTTPPSQLKLDVTSGSNLNPNIFGRPSPVYVTVMQLKDPQTFNTADYFALEGQASQVLGSNLIAQKTILVTPSFKNSVDLSIDPQTRYLGVVAAYDQLDSAAWRTGLPINSDTDKLVMQVDANKVSLAKE